MACLRWRITLHIVTEKSPWQTATAVPPFSAPCYEALSLAQLLLAASAGPAHKQPTVNEQPLAVLPSYWSTPQWALSTGTIGKVIQSRVRGVVVIRWKVR